MLFLFCSVESTKWFQILSLIFPTEVKKTTHRILAYESIDVLNLAIECEFHRDVDFSGPWSLFVLKHKTGVLGPGLGLEA